MGEFEEKIEKIKKTFKKIWRKEKKVVTLHTQNGRDTKSNPEAKQRPTK